MKIMIIGTQPPCPRCDILGLWVEEAIKELGSIASVDVVHVAFSDPAAIAFGAKNGLKVGTAKHVALEAGIPIDQAAVDEWFEKRMSEVDDYQRPADIWDEGLDCLLAPFQEAAEGASYLMTPVLVIDGAVKHHGSVPSKREIREWIEGSL